MKQRIGLMLGGGGAKGAYQLGVIKALEEKGLTKNIKAVSGTSIGAINTLLFMVNKKYAFMEKMWQYMDKEYVFQEARKDHKGVYDVHKLFSTVSASISIEKVRNSKINGFATACRLLNDNTIFSQLDFKKMEIVVFNLKTTKEPFKAILASSSIPLIFGYTEIAGELFVDGGVLNNYPVEPLLDDGCNIIFSVPLDPRFKQEKYQQHDILHIDFGSYSIFHKNLLVDLADAIRFNKNFEQEVFLLGYKAAKRMLEKCFDKGYLLKNASGKWCFYKPKGYTYLSLSRKEENNISKAKMQIEDKQKNKETIIVDNLK